MSSYKKIPFQPTFNLTQDVEKKLRNFKHKILVLSGKGGVGKTFISSMLSLAIAEKGKTVAILDADIHGSSIPSILGLHGTRHYADEEGNILPVEGPLGVKVVAVNLMLDSPDLPIVWRGPLVSRAILDLLSKVKWGSGDYLIVDLPPGTGDAIITITQSISSITGAIIVTAPNMLSETIVSKAINFAAKYNIRLLGIVENLSYFKCPHCGRPSQVLGKSTGEQLAGKFGTRLLAKIPIDPLINDAIDQGVPYILAYNDGEAAKAIRALADELISIVES
ncbi:Mrp/NBP35 family ATP-binding protein [Thermosphaera sp.]|uniref:Iron-sulfur cluster carrier protein n=1 Tax=Thermosphaera aggregans TaxID=54254 RepID=A0A7C2BLA3_9CREN